MPFPFALSRTIILFVIIVTNVITSVLSTIAFHEDTGGGTLYSFELFVQKARNDARLFLAFQVLAICISVFILLSIFGCLYHQFANRGEEASNARNVGMFSLCGLLGLALAVSLTVHARQDQGVAFCNNFANAKSPCILAGVQLSMVYTSSTFTLVGFVISWIDKFPGAVKIAPRYPITKAPSSHFAAYGHDLDGTYTCPPVRMPPRSWNNSGWSDVPLH